MEVRAVEWLGRRRNFCYEYRPFYNQSIHKLVHLYTHGCDHIFISVYRLIFIKIVIFL